MNLKNFFYQTFQYKPLQEYQFNIGSDTENVSKVEDTFVNKKTDVFTSLSVNEEFLKSKYNLLINSDVVLRNFTLNARGKQYNAFIIYIDGMVDSQILDDFILKPLMLKNRSNSFEGPQNRVISEAVANNITVRKVKKFSLSNYLMSCLMPQNAVTQLKDFDEIANGINSGNCALFVDTLDVAFDIEVKGFKQRSIDSPNNETIIKGPQEAFVENIRTNTSLLRRIINNENLIIENVEVGKITKTKCAVCYIDNLTNNDLVNEVKFRLHNLELDSLLSAGELEQLLADSDTLGVPQVLLTERPDKASKFLLNGRVVVIVNGTPYAIVMPGLLFDFLTSPEDTNLKTSFGNFLRALRIVAAFITLLLPRLICCGN